MHDDQRFITYLQQNDHRGISQIYQLFAPKIIQMIRYNSGTRADAADVMQEALVSIYKMCSERDYVLSCPFEAFFVMVCKRKWFSMLKKRSGSPVTNSLDDGYTFEKENMEAKELADQLEREEALMRVLDTMGKTCRDIIRGCMGKDPQEKVAERLGYTYAYLRKKKSECLTQLGKLVREHPLFKL